jgi:signal transduction histidine kinase
LVQQLTVLRSLFKFHSGRVISLGRVMLAITLVLIFIFGRGQPDVTQSYPFLVLYAAVATLIAAVTWKNWWLDARLAMVTHGVDMAVFTGLAFSTTGTSSPFILFFILPLLSAAVRWSWRETALTAAVLIVLFLVGGYLLSSSTNFELQRFVLRSANLVILTLLLIWFGIHQRFARTFFRVEDFEVTVREGENPLARSLGFAMRASQAARGVLIVGRVGEEPSDGFFVTGGEERNFTADAPIILETGAESPVALLFDIGEDRTLTRPPEGRFRFGSARETFNLDEARAFGLNTGVVAQIATGTHCGWLVLSDVPDLSTDFLDFGRELAGSVGALLERYALVDAIEAGAAVRARLSLARDVHDSIVQFLAGASFRIEAIKRAAGSGAAVEADLDELKRLFVEEQDEIRGYVMALRQHRDLELAEAVAELRSLAERLGSQWSIDCRVKAKVGKVPIPIRLAMDLQQLLREAVANAVRHGGADRIDVDLSVTGDHVRLNVIDNGRGFEGANGAVTAEPWSLKERVERAHGSLRLNSVPGSTNLLISLPLRGVAA